MLDQIERDIDENKKLSKNSFKKLKELVIKITSSQEEYAEKYGKDKSIQSDSIKRKERIKNIDGLSNSKQDLATLNEIEVTDYHMIDPSHGEKSVKKAIAQQLEKVYPQAVSKSTNCIPDIYKLADCKAGIIQIQNNLSSGERIRLIFENKEEITTVVSATANLIKTNQNHTGKVFVYGREVNDFRTVDYQAISMLNVSATQALLKRVEALELENAALKLKNEEFQDLKVELETLQKSVSLLIQDKTTAINQKD